MLFLSFIPIVYKWLKDANNKNKDLKIKIYYMVFKTILQNIYPSFFFVDFKKVNSINIVILLKYKDNIELVYTNGYEKHCYFIPINLIVDYKKQVLIKNIKANMQYLICYILPKK